MKYSAKEYVSWCFKPSQPVPLYQGDSARECYNNNNNNNNNNKIIIIIIANLGILSPVFESLVQDIQEMASGFGIDDTKAKHMMQQWPQKGKHH